jgi:hypothetical protein
VKAGTKQDIKQVKKANEEPNEEPTIGEQFKEKTDKQF